MGREALEANVIGGTSHATPAGVRSQSGSIYASELNLQSNDAVEFFSLKLGSTSPLIHRYVSRWTKRSCQAPICPKKVQLGSREKRGEEEDKHYDATHQRERETRFRS